MSVKASAIEEPEVKNEETNANSKTLAQDLRQRVMSVKASAIELLEVMIEETNVNSKTLAQGIAQDLSVADVMSTMKAFWTKVEVWGLDKTESERAIFRAYHVLKKIADYTGKSIDSYVEFDANYKEDEDMKYLWSHLRDSSRSIEVNYVTKNEEILTKVYFPFSPSKELTETDKDVVKNNIRRDSPEDKVKDLLEWMQSIRKNVRHKTKIKHKWYLYWAVTASGLRHLMLVILTLLLNLFVVFLFDVPERDNSTANYMIVQNTTVASWFSDYLIFILGTFHIILSIWMVCEYFVREAPNLLFKIPFLAGLLYDFKKWTDRYDFIRKSKTAINEVFCAGKMPPVTKPVSSQCFEVYFISFPPLYRLLFLFCSIVAMATNGYFYCGCILYIFLNDDVLQQVLTALRRSAAQLVSVALLGLGILLIFSVISFVFLHNFFDNETVFCRSMFECYVSVIREGLLDTIGTMLPVQYIGQADPSFTIYAVKTIFDLAFFIIITTLGLNIVVAIIVDRFSELRSERDEIKSDKLNYCFVCGIDNDTFERKGKGFRDHVLNDHHMWNYVYFLLHLDSMHPNDHNALEKYINDNIEGRKIGFFPLRKAKILGGKVDESAVQKS